MSDEASVAEEQELKALVKKAKDLAVDKILPGSTTLFISAVTDRKDIIAAASHIAQRQKQEGWLKALVNEWDDLCEKGRVKPDYLETEQGQACRQELFDHLDKDKPETGRFDALRKIFFVAATADPSQWEDPRPQEFMIVCRELTSTQLLILGVAYKLNKEMSHEEKSKVHGLEAWNQKMIQGSDGKLSTGIIMRNEQMLIDKRLIGDRNNPDGSGIQKNNDFRLDSLGLELCEFLEKYEK